MECRYTCKIEIPEIIYLKTETEQGMECYGRYTIWNNSIH